MFAAIRTLSARISLAILFAFLVTLCHSSVFGQDPDGHSPNRGVLPTGSYALSDLESVSLSNGDMTYLLPLASLPASRGGELKPSVSLFYSSKLYDTKVTIATGGTPFNYTQTDLVEAPFGGWSYGVWYQLDVTDRSTNYLSNTPEPQRTYKFKAAIVFPDGSKHTIRPYGYAEIDDYYSVYPGTSGPANYYSTDGQYFRVNFHAGGWTIYFADGGTVAKDTTSGVQTVTDSNGNYFTVQNVTLPNSNPATRVTDQLGRTITIETPLTKPDYVRVNGYGAQELVTTVNWGTTHPQGKRYLWKAYSDGTEVFKNLPNIFPTVTSIVLPNGLSYQFDYNSNIYDPSDPTKSVGWGELYKITLPTGAWAQYSYFMDNTHDEASSVTPLDVLRDYPTQKALHYDDIHDGAITPRTDITTYGIAFGQNTSAIAGSVGGPDGGVTSEYFYDQSAGDKEGLSYKTAHPDGSVTEKIWQFNVPNGGNGHQINPYVKTEFKSITNSGGALVKTAIKDFTYDKNGNLTQLAEYDWVNYGDVPRDGTGRPTGIPATAQVKRVSVNAFFNPTPAASDSTTNDPDAYHLLTAPNVRNALDNGEVRSGFADTTALSRMELGYDNPTTTANVTQEKSWDSTKAGISRPLTAGNSISTTHQYDSYGNRTLTTDANGVQTQFIYDPINGHENLYVTQTKVASSTVVQRWTTQAYDFHTGLVMQSTDMDNNVTTRTTYDVFGRPTLVQEAYGINGVEKQTSTEYSDTERRVIVRSDLNTTGDGKLITVQHYDQLGRICLTRRLESGNPTEATDKTKGVKIQNRYFAGDAGNPNGYELVSAPYRAATSGAAGGEPGMAWKRTKFDNGGKVIEVETFVGATPPAPWGSNSVSSGKFTTEYDAEFTTVTDQAGKKRRSRVDALGRLVRVDEPDAVGNLGGASAPVQPTDYTYNALDNLIQTSQMGVPNGGSTQVTQIRTFTFSSLGRLISANNPESGPVTHEYDANGNLMKKTDARGVFIDYTYDELNRNRTLDYSNTAVNPDITRVYDNPAAGAYGKGKFWKDYAGGDDSNGQNVEHKAVDSYDALGRPLSVRRQFKNNGVWSNPFTTSQTYDLAGHIITKAYPSGRSVMYTYDVSGDLTDFTGNIGDGVSRTYSTGIQYNPQGQLIREQFGTSTPLYHRRHYNSRGQLFDVRLGTDSSAINDGPDPAQWTGASWNRGALRMFFSSNLIDYAWPAVAPQANNGNLHRQDYFVPTALDSGGNVTSWTMSADYYCYDSLNRVAQTAEETYTSGGGYTPNVFNQQFSYDRFGNRLVNSAAGTGVPNPGFKINGANNRLIAPTDVDGGQASDKMRYDASGNLIKDTHTQTGTTGNRTYDAENRMTAADGANGLANSYAYDADGHRTRRSLNNGGEVWWQVFGISGELVAEYQLVSGTPTLKKEYGYRTGQLLVIAETTGTCQWLVTDALGTPRMIADQTGGLSGVKRRDYLPFGEELLAGVGHRQPTNGYSLSQSLQPRQQFTGKERDSETELDYFEARYYGSVYGRFTSPDEFTGGPDELYDFADVASDNPTFYADLIDPQSLNKYQYCYNNPLTTVDPDGHKGWREYARQAVSVAADFGNGVIRGAAASAAGALGLGTPPGAGPSSNDSWTNIAGQIVGTAIVGGAGTQMMISGTGVAVLTSETGVGAVAGAGVAALGAASAYGAAKNATSILMAAKSKIDSGSGQGSGGVSSSGGGPNASNKKPVVIGENMKRIKAYVKENKGTTHYKPRNWTMQNNRRWIREMKKQGREIIDIGPDPNRKKRRSTSYKMESEEVQDYPFRRKVY